MRTRFAIPRCCCTGAPEFTCLLGEDDFERADNDDIDDGSPCGWTEQSGSSLQIVSGEVLGNGIAIFGQEKTVRPQVAKATGAFRFTATNGTMRIIAHWTDADNYAAIQYKHESTQILVSFILRKNGSETVTDVREHTHTLDTSQEFEYCILFHTQLAVSWTLQSILTSPVDEPDFISSLTWNIILASAIDITGTFGFKQNNTSLAEFALWRSPLDNAQCTPCRTCAFNEMTDDFSTGTIVEAAPRDFTGRWSQISGVTYDRSEITGGVLQMGLGAGRVYRCWKEDAFVGFWASLESEFTQSNGGQGSWQYMYLISPEFFTYWPAFGIRLAHFWIEDLEDFYQRYCLEVYDGATQTLSVLEDVVPEDGDILKVYMEKVSDGPPPQYSFKGYLNSVEEWSVTRSWQAAGIGTQYQQITFLSSTFAPWINNPRAQFDDVHFITNAAPEEP